MTGIPAPPQQTRLAFTTYRDAVLRLLDQSNQMANDGSTSSRPRRLAQAAVKYANDNLVSYSDTWSLYRGVTQVSLPAAFTTGTVVVDATAQTATLTGGTWPAWAWYGELHFGASRVAVASRDSDTVLSLLHGVSDYSGTYSLLSSMIPISPLIRKADSVFDVDRGIGLASMSFDNTRRYASSKPWLASYPSLVTIAGDERLMGGLALHVQPATRTARTLEFSYHRRPRPLRTYELTGTVTVSGSTATVDEAFLKSHHVGSIISVGDEDRVIIAVTSTTVATLDSAWSIDADSEFSLSDPLDVLPGAMTEAMLRLAEKELSRTTVQDKADFRSSGFDKALKLAMYEDSMMTTPASAVPWFTWGGLALGEVNVV